MRKKKEQAPTKVTAPAPNPALIEWEKRCKRLAAKLCLEAPPLIGVDIRSRDMCAEGMVRYGVQERHQVTLHMLEYCMVPYDTMRYLVHGEGPHGSDRMVAIWWDALRRYHTVAYSQDVIERGRRNDYGELASSGEALLALVDRPALDLITDGILCRDANDVFSLGFDPFMDRRKKGRALLDRFLAGLKAEAEG